MTLGKLCLWRYQTPTVAGWFAAWGYATSDMVRVEAPGWVGCALWRLLRALKRGEYVADVSARVRDGVLLRMLRRFLPL